LHMQSNITSDAHRGKESYR